MPEYIINSDNIDKTDHNLKENKFNFIDYDLILKQVLLPFFKIKPRILKKRIFFDIGDIKFKVLGISPVKYGHISNNTFIRLNK